MKKNTITKLLLIMVMLLLVFSLFACGNKDNNGGGSGTKEQAKVDTPVLKITGSTVSWGTTEGASGKYRITIYNPDDTVKETIDNYNVKSYDLLEGEGIVVVALPKNNKYKESDPSEKMTYQSGVAAQLISLVQGVQGIIDTLNDVQATDTLSADLSVGGYFKTNGKRNSASVFALANAGVDDPEAMIGFKLNEKDYVTLGYKDDFIYVREPLNLVNNDDEDALPNAFKIDVSALDGSAEKLVEPLMELIAKQDINFDKITGAVTSLMSNNIFAQVAEILKFVEEDGNKVLSLNVGTLSFALGLTKAIPNMDIPGEINKYLGYFYQVTDALGIQRIQLDGVDLSYDSILAKLKNKSVEENKLLNLVISYNSQKVVNGLNVVIDLGSLGLQGIDYELGLEIKLPTFSKTSTVNMNAVTTGFTAQNLEIDLSAALGQKGLDADAKATIRLADAFANKTNKWATLEVKSGDETALAYIDATGAYADFGPIFTILGAVPAEGIKTQYKATFKNDNDQDINLIDTILEKIGVTSGPANAAQDEIDAFMADPKTYVMNIATEFGAASNKIDYVCGKAYPFLEWVDEEATAFLPAQGPATQATVIAYAFGRELGDSDSCLADYALFYKDNQDNAATTFEGLWNNIKACHEAGKDALDAATSAEGGKAGVQFFDPATEENDLLDYIAHFVKVPTISEDPDTHEDEPDFANLVAINNAANLKDWLDWIFPYDPDAEENEDYREMVEDILGITLYSIIDGGVYFEAVDLGGFNGAVRAAASDAENAAEYVYLAAGFGMKATSAAPAGTITTETEFNGKDDGTGKYFIADMAKALLTALRTYGTSN